MTHDQPIQPPSHHQPDPAARCVTHDHPPDWRAMTRQDFNTDSGPPVHSTSSLGRWRPTTDTAPGTPATA
jgi:hypothetical protein